ncbi:hypothetical protein EGH90_06070 [Kaistella haifensis]|nr:hypothetical protein EGH90_06070 [Kaistella haifensis]
MADFNDKNLKIDDYKTGFCAYFKFAFQVFDMYDRLFHNFNLNKIQSGGCHLHLLNFRSAGLERVSRNEKV